MFTEYTAGKITSPLMPNPLTLLHKNNTQSTRIQKEALEITQTWICQTDAKLLIWRKTRAKKHVMVPCTEAAEL